MVKNWNKRSLRNSGWRGPLLPGPYQDMVFAILSRPEYEGKGTRAVFEDALTAFATADEREAIAGLGRQ